jgi:hypothetical protein
MISDRPAEIEDRAVPGHWEGNLIVGTRNEHAIVTLVERSTRYVLLGHLPGGHTAEEVRDVLVPLIQTLPEHLRGSLNWDQSCEMAAHKQFSVAAGVPVYFCDPHSPWQPACVMQVTGASVRCARGRGVKWGEGAPRPSALTVLVAPTTRTARQHPVWRAYARPPTKLAEAAVSWRGPDGSRPGPKRLPC